MRARFEPGANFGDAIGVTIEGRSPTRRQAPRLYAPPWGLDPAQEALQKCVMLRGRIVALPQHPDNVGAVRRTYCGPIEARRSQPLQEGFELFRRFKRLIAIAIAVQ